jgi:hypothetical protein
MVECHAGVGIGGNRPPQVAWSRQPAQRESSTQLMAQATACRGGFGWTDGKMMVGHGKQYGGWNGIDSAARSMGIFVSVSRLQPEEALGMRGGWK